MSSTPQLSFTEDDVRALRAFGKLLTERAVFRDSTVDEVSRLHAHFSHFNQIIKKVEAHILELRRVTEAPPEEKPRRGK